MAMDYTKLIKKLEVPDGFTVPVRLAFEDLEARAISRSDLREDVRGINASISLIQRTRGGGWPTEPVTEDYNFVDLVWHELEFRDRVSFTYAVYETAGAYVGCCYLYPLGRRTELTRELLDCDVDVSWWVTPDAYARGRYTRLYAALQHWLAVKFPFWKAHYSNVDIPSDVPPATGR
jgi:hypothetical protein